MRLRSYLHYYKFRGMPKHRCFSGILNYIVLEDDYTLRFKLTKFFQRKEISQQSNRRGKYTNER